MNDKVIVVLLLMMTLILEVALGFASHEMWKMEEKICSWLFLAMLIVSSVAFGYLLIGGLTR